MMFRFPFVLKKTYDAKVAELEKANQRLKEAFRDIAYQSDLIEEYRPDALAMRRKRQMDRDRKAAKKEGA